MSEEPKTIEVAEETETPEVLKPEVPTVAELKKKGWSKEELASAEKRGMFSKPEDKKEEPKKETVAPITKKEEPKKETNFLDEMDKELSPEQEKTFLEMFPPGTKPRAFYFRAKNERAARQRIEVERDRLQLELQLRKDGETNKGEEVVVERDKDGNIIDPEDKPLTMKQLKAMQKKEMEEMNKSKEELTKRSEKVSDALKTQEEYAKSTIPDFEDTVNLATDLVNNIDSITDPIKKSKALKLIRDLQITAATADKYGVDDYTASMIAYEIGQMHPKYGQKADPNGTKADPKNGTMTPEQMKRIEENTNRRTSSASLPGSSNGRRTVSVDDITVKDLLRMDSTERRNFKNNHPDRFAKLMRG